MRGALFVVFFHLLGSSAHDTACLGESLSDHDDTLLLQVKAVTTEAKNKRRIHRFRVHMQDDVVSMLQGSHTLNSEIFQICANDDSGSDVETTDDFENKADSCGTLDVSNEAGEFVTSILGCLPESVGEGDCYALVESSDFFSSHSEGGPNAVRSLHVNQHIPQSAEVFLIEIPTMDDNSFLKAMNEVKEKVALIPGVVVLFQGKGAQQARKHMAIHGKWIFTFTIFVVCIIATAKGAEGTGALAGYGGNGRSWPWWQR